MAAERWTTRLVREPAPAWMAKRLRGPADVEEAAKDLLGDEAQEVMIAFFLNAQNRVIAYHEITRGIVDASLIHAREVMRPAILANASAVILVHNHPSGCLDPSHEDVRVTKTLSEAGELLGIPLVDHVIVTANGLCSVSAEGKL